MLQLLQRPLSALILIAPLAILCVCSSASLAAENVAVEWRFDADGDFRGWVASGDIRDPRVAGGALAGEPTDSDPILLGPVFDVAARPGQCVEIKMHTSQAGEAQLFWTETTEGKFGGFSEQKSDRFATSPGDEFHQYRIHPFWHAAGKVVRLRFDPPSDGRFAIQSIRVVDEGSPTPSPATAWRFNAGCQGWHAWRDLAEPVVRDGRLCVTAQGKSPVLMSPTLAVSADEHPYVSIRMATKQGTTGRVFCVSSTQFGWEDVTFPLRPGGKMHTYNVDVGHLDHWRDSILLIGIQPTDVEGADAAIESIQIAEAPLGPAELEIGYFGPADAINRAGRPVEVTLTARNLGGEVAENVLATLGVPEGIRVVGSPRQAIEKLTPWLPKRAAWQIEGSRPGKVGMAVKLEAPGIGTVLSTASIELTPALKIPQTSYIPEPQPVKSPYEVGVFYFPGWDSMSRWRPIFDYPKRKPVLGWYDEANPECADWQIKWAVEHGITFFMVDWYWCQGNRHLEHWVHDAYMKARFR
jgi:hypothetical protein